MEEKNIIFYYPYEWDKETLDFPFEWCFPNIEKRQKPMVEVFLQNNVNIFLVRFMSAYIWKEEFIPNYIYKSGEWDNYSWPSIYSHLTIGLKIPKEVKNIFPNLHEYMRDKSITERLFPEYCIRSIECWDYEERKNHFYRIPTTQKVLKPYNSSQWKWIIIGKNLPSKNLLVDEFYPYLLQEFLDTSKWFWKYTWYHDFRIIILSWEIIAKILRQPKKWNLIANVAQEWVLIDLEKENIPKKISNIVKEIDVFFAKKATT
jgi:hypothetical protein